MKDSYTTLLHAGESEYTEKRSRFLGHARPCKSEEEALRFLSEMRKIYSDARHNVYAYLLSDGNLMRYSDDAEPQGTAGMPVLEVLAQKRRYRRCGRCDPVFRRHLARHRGIGARLFRGCCCSAGKRGDRHLPGSRPSHAYLRLQRVRQNKRASAVLYVSSGEYRVHRRRDLAAAAFAGTDGELFREAAGADSGEGDPADIGKPVCSFLNGAPVLEKAGGRIFIPLCVYYM